MKFIPCLIVSSLLLVSAVQAQEHKLKPVSFVSAQESMKRIIESPPPAPTYAVPQSSNATSNSQKIVMTSIGGGLMALGIVLAATAGKTATVTVSDGFGGTITASASTIDNGRRWGGVGLACAGGGLMIYGVTRK